MRRILFLLLGAALAGALGLLVYLCGRHPAQAQWIPAVPALAGTLSFGQVGGWLPSLAHVLAFSLLTAACLPRTGRAPLAACAVWSLVNAAFELAQLPQLAVPLSQGLRAVAPDLAMAHAVARYLLNGTFDPRDLLACGAGGLLAAALVHGRAGRWPRGPGRAPSQALVQTAGGWPTPMSRAGESHAS